jgi:hypothetical protein
MGRPRLRSSFIVVLGLLGAACSSDDPTGTGGVCHLGTFQLNPNGGSPYTLTQEYRFLCRDGVMDPDVQYIYDDCPADSDGFFWFYSGGVLSTFVANLSEYSFNGSVVRDFGGGVGPFASGTYEKKSGGATVEVGQFSFNEGDIELPGTLDCLYGKTSDGGRQPLGGE